ncbi:sulfotransferase family 2 domain-containing protein [Roseovarius aestuariivivens]|uniref:sulfotransferase family 2 domain-containing protein n=1 Tax=Roseovarius aestuariivivens TaxID=1888910 RepID=UPI0010814B38|nr:sulfotransferase family 2 domain-containing protein [Roseovarius aestuariivivens]
MIISPGRGYIFVHIPKTGGTSMALALEGRAKKDDILIGDTPKALRRRKRLKGVKTAGRLWKHSTLADLDGLVSLQEIGAAFCFTLVRNPWDRAVSYYHWLREQRFDHPAVRRAQTMTFSRFLAEPHTQKSFRKNPYPRAMIAADGNEHADLYIRLEHFEEDAAHLWQHLGFKLELPHENASARSQSHRNYYSDKDAETLAACCAEDIARFSYRF